MHLWYRLTLGAIRNVQNQDAPNPYRHDSTAPVKTTTRAEYQWIRVLGSESIQNPSGATPNDSYGPISDLAPQQLAVNYSYVLPFGRGKAFFSGGSNLLNKFIDDWQISGISTFRNGQPFSVNCDPSSLQGTV